MNGAGVSIMRGWIGSFVLLASAFCLLGSERAFSHWDGSPSADGHAYWSANLQSGYKYRTPQEFAEAWGEHNVANVCSIDSVIFEQSTPGKWRATWTNGTFCNGSGAVEFEEKHCAIGTNAVDGVCVPTSHCNLPAVGWVAVSEGGNYANGDGCLLQKVGSSSNGACYNVEYEGTGWLSADEDDFTVALPDGDPVVAAPDACEGHTSPFGPVVPDLEASERCPAGEIVFLSGWEQGDPHVTPETVCSSANCRAEIDSSTEFCAAYCIADGELTGSSCTGTETVSLVSPSGEGSGEVVAELQRIYSRLGEMSNRSALGDAAIVAAVEGIEGGGGGGDNSDLIGEHGDEDPAGDIDGLGSDLDDEFDELETDLTEADFFDAPTEPGGIADSIVTALPGDTCVDLTFPIPGDPVGVTAEITCSDLEDMRLLIGWVMKIALAMYLFHLGTTRPQGAA